MKHRIQINVARPDGEQQRVLKSKRLRLPGRLISFLFGDYSEVILLKPGDSVLGVEIHEQKAGAME